MHIYQIIGLVICGILFIIITSTIFSKKHVLSYQHVAGYAVLIIAILMILRLVELTFDPEKKLVTIKGIQKKINSLTENVKKIETKSVFLDFSGIDIAENISVETRDEIIDLYNNVKAAIKDKNLYELASLYSKNYLKGELNKRAAIEIWKKYLDKEIFFYLREISVAKNNVFKVKGSAIILEDTRQWHFEDFISLEDGQYQFIG